MKTVLIIHGIGGHAGIHWQQWLHDELEKRGYKVLMPGMPNPDHPDRNAWLDEATKTIKGANLNDLTIVAHSLGVTTALDFIEQAKGKLNALISVSGFAKEYGAELNQYFLTEKLIDFEKVKQHLDRAVVVYGNDDPYVTQAALKYVADSLDVKPLIIPEGGHLNTEAGYDKFPKLLELLR